MWFAFPLTLREAREYLGPARSALASTEGRARKCLLSCMSCPPPLFFQGGCLIGTYKPRLP